MKKITSRDVERDYRLAIKEFQQIINRCESLGDLDIETADATGKIIKLCENRTAAIERRLAQYGEVKAMQTVRLQELEAEAAKLREEVGDENENQTDQN